ncbi:hypothetical protein BH23GEM6_BH23GEM6_03690 [soil metagenome]
MKLLALFGVLMCTLFTAASAESQERQVPLDESGRIQVVDAALARQLGMWTEQYPGFTEARLFQAAAGDFILEITTQARGETRRIRVPMSADDVAELRASVSARMVESRALAPQDQEGRYLLLGQTTIAGLSFYGWAVPEIVGATGTGTAGLYLLTAAASFFVPFALTHDQPVTFGMANLSRYGVTRGTFHGSLLHYAIAGDGGYRERLAAGVSMSIAEGVGGYLWARNEVMTAGTANAIVTFGDAGLAGGAGLGRLVSDEGRVVAAMGVAGSAAGILGGRAMAARRDYTWGDADFIYTGATVGLLSGLAMGVIASADDDRVYVALGMAGGAAGLLLGDRLVAETDFSVGQAVLNRLGSLAGGLAGASIGVLMEDEKVAIGGAALGAIGGYMLTYSALAPDARAGRGERFSRFDVNVSPHALMGFSRGFTGTAGSPMPLINVNYRLGGSAGAR